MDLRIAHLSDIHFRNDPKQIGRDPNESMREDIIQDLERRVAEFGSLDVLIISGDIAYSGKKEEFASARVWIYELLERTNSRAAKVLICPGNHDIDRDVFSNQFILDAHDAIRAPKEHEQIQKALMSRLETESGKTLLMESLENYNNFAVQYGCDFYPDRLRYSWSHDLELNDGSTLRVRGLNSTILCGKKDRKGSLFLGRNAWNIQKKDGVEFLIFAHHPPSWLADETEMKNELDDRAKIQMYGHEHSAKIDPGVNSVRLFAGAINPERDHPGWKPGYNFLRVHVDTEGESRKLVVIVNAREWQETPPSQFKEYRGLEADGSHKYSFALRPWKQVIGKTATPVLHVAHSDGEVVNERVAMDESTPSLPPISEQEFLRKFFDLSFVDQKIIFDELGLSDPKEASSPQFVQIKNNLARAKERGLLGAIANKINREK